MIFALGLLLDAALKGTILIAAAAIAAYLLRSHSAAARHAAWTAAVVGHLALPAVTLLVPAWRLPFLPAPPWLQSSAPRTVTASSVEPAQLSVNSSQPAVPNSEPAISTKPTVSAPTDRVPQRFPLTGISLIAALWIAGV